MAKKGNRRHIILTNKESGQSYHTNKNIRNTTERIKISKYDPVLRRHAIFEEEK